MPPLAKCIHVCSECCCACCVAGFTCCEGFCGHLAKAFADKKAVENKDEDAEELLRRQHIMKFSETSELISSVDPMLIPPSICIAEEVTPFKF